MTKVFVPPLQKKWELNNCCSLSPDEWTKIQKIQKIKWTKNYSYPQIFYFTLYTGNEYYPASIKFLISSIKYTLQFQMYVSGVMSRQVFISIYGGSGLGYSIYGRKFFPLYNSFSLTKAKSALQSLFSGTFPMAKRGLLRHFVAATQQIGPHQLGNFQRVIIIS